MSQFVDEVTLWVSSGKGGDGSASFRRLTIADKTPSFCHDHVQLRTPHLVVHAGGHMRQFYGMAYVPSLVPANLSISDLH